MPFASCLGWSLQCNSETDLSAAVREDVLLASCGGRLLPHRSLAPLYSVGEPILCKLQWQPSNTAIVTGRSLTYTGQGARVLR